MNTEYKITKNTNRPRRKIEIYPNTNFYHSDAVSLTLTRAGIEVSGYYDSIVGISGFSISWSELDELRAQVLEKISRTAAKRS